MSQQCDTAAKKKQTRSQDGWINRSIVSWTKDTTDIQIWTTYAPLLTLNWGTPARGGRVVTSILPLNQWGHSARRQSNSTNTVSSLNAARTGVKTARFYHLVCKAVPRPREKSGRDTIFHQMWGRPFKQLKLFKNCNSFVRRWAFLSRIIFTQRCLSTFSAQQKFRRNVRFFVLQVRFCGKRRTG